MRELECHKPKRLGVTLDPELVIERAILKRFLTMTGKRGEAWLRGLVGLGFLAEGRWLRIEAPTCRCGLGTSRTRAPTNPYAQNLERTRGEKAARGLPAPVTQAACAAAIPGVVNITGEVAPVTASSGESGVKPLAHLARVIG